MGQNDKWFEDNDVMCCLQSVLVNVNGVRTMRPSANCRGNYMQLQWFCCDWNLVGNVPVTVNHSSGSKANKASRTRSLGTVHRLKCYVKQNASNILFFCMYWILRWKSHRQNDGCERAVTSAETNKFPSRPFRLIIIECIDRIFCLALACTILHSLPLHSLQECSIFLFEKRCAEKLHKPKRKEAVTEILRNSVKQLERFRHPKVMLKHSVINILDIYCIFSCIYICAPSLVQRVCVYCVHIFFSFQFLFNHSVGFCFVCVRHPLLLDLLHRFFSPFIRLSFSAMHVCLLGCYFSFSHFTLPCISFVFLSFDVVQNKHCLSVHLCV